MPVLLSTDSIEQVLGRSRGIGTADEELDVDVSGLVETLDRDTDVAGVIRDAFVGRDDDRNRDKSETGADDRAGTGDCSCLR